MGLTLAPQHEYVIGDRLEMAVNITFDSSYPTGGEALTAATLGLSELDWVSPNPDLVGHHFAYDYANGKLLAFSGGSEVADTTSLATVTTRVLVKGKGFPITGV